MDTVVYNTSANPYRLDDEGHTLGGLEFGTADSSADAVKQGLDDGTLVKVRRPKKNDDINPQVQEAFDSLGSSDNEPDDDGEGEVKKPIKKRAEQ